MDQLLNDINTMENNRKTNREWLQSWGQLGQQAIKAAEKLPHSHALDAHAYSISDALGGAFTWMDSEEGHDFWDDHHSALQKNERVYSTALELGYELSLMEFHMVQSLINNKDVTDDELRLIILYSVGGHIDWEVVKNEGDISRPDLLELVGKMSLN
jgi:hypothetical protein